MSFECISGVVTIYEAEVVNVSFPLLKLWRVEAKVSSCVWLKKKFSCERFKFAKLSKSISSFNVHIRLML